MPDESTQVGANPTGVDDWLHGKFSPLGTLGERGLDHGGMGKHKRASVPHGTRLESGTVGAAVSGYNVPKCQSLP